MHIVMFFSKLLMALFIGIALAKTPHCPGIEEMAKQKIVPDIIGCSMKSKILSYGLDELPKSVMDVQFGDLKANMGNELTSYDIAREPDVFWEAKADKSYILTAFTPKIYHYWFAANIPGQNIANRTASLGYHGARPGADVGLIKVIYLAYEQPNKKIWLDKKIYNRTIFVLREFVRKHNLGQPVAGNFFTTQCKRLKNGRAACPF